MITSHEVSSSATLVKKLPSGEIKVISVEDAAIEIVQNMRTVKKKDLGWFCQGCNKNCCVIREECRCLCGHRLKQHPRNENGVYKCKEAKCKCVEFFYIVAEGSWILRCRCKHKHIEHDSSKKSHPCTKAKCKCDGFDSPWVCNCNHEWGLHEQRVFEREIVPLSVRIEEEGIGDPTQVMRGLD